jgi:chaperonin GroES
MILKADELPALPEADRIMVRPNPPITTTIGGLEIPDIALLQAHQGRIIAAGLKAMDIMHDNGQQIGDEVLYGQFAGAWEEWDHIMKPGNNPDCIHEEWSRHSPSSIRDEKSKYRCSGYRCDACGALRLQEPLLIMNVGDIMANVDKASRQRSGDMMVVMGHTIDGKTNHVILRKGEAYASSDSTATNGVTHVTA